MATWRVWSWFDKVKNFGGLIKKRGGVEREKTGCCLGGEQESGAGINKETSGQGAREERNGKLFSLG